MYTFVLFIRNENTLEKLQNYQNYEHVVVESVYT